MKKKSIYILTFILIFTACQSEKSKVNEFVKHVVEDTEINGYLYVEKDNQILWNGIIHNPSLSVETINDSAKVYLASLSKLFTEIAILKLSDQGRIQLNSTINEHRDSFEPTFGQKIKVIDLLKMSSGLPRELNQDALPKAQFDNYKFAGPFLDTIPDFELSFEPGSKEEYSNLNYWILGSIIEKVTNKSLQNAFTELIFDELDMKSSGLFNTEEVIQKGYFYEKDKWELDNTVYESRYSSGGCFSSIKDLILLSKALSGSNFLKSDSKKVLQNSKNKIEVYGSLPGNSNMFIQNFEYDYIIISLNNIGLRDLSFMTTLKNGIENELGIEKEVRAKRVVKLDPIENLSDSVSIEKSLKAWVQAVESRDAYEIYKTLNSISVKGSISEEDRTWKDLSELNSTLPNFRALGFRWVKDEKPEGIEVWFGSDKNGKLAIRWLVNEDNPSFVENIFIMPDDMTWQGKSY